jgi:hypothetical protein
VRFQVPGGLTVSGLKAAGACLVFGQLSERDEAIAAIGELEEDDLSCHGERP